MVIEHNMFDALTLERMLQFMYTGDYTVNVTGAAVDGQVDADSQASNDYATSDEANPALPPHARRRTAKQLFAETLRQEPEPAPSVRYQIAATDPAIAHVYVYAIAGYYSLADLKDLALQKYSDPSIAIDVDQFADVVEAVYSCTWEHDDGLRLETLNTALAQIEELMSSETFMQALAEASGLQDFAAQLLPKAVEQASNRGGQMEEIQHAMNAKEEELRKAKEELTELDSRRLKLIESVKKQNEDVKKQNEEVSKANKEAQSVRTRLVTLELQVQQKSDEAKTARTDLASAQQRVRTLEAEKTTVKPNYAATLQQPKQRQEELKVTQNQAEQKQAQLEQTQTFLAQVQDDLQRSVAVKKHAWRRFHKRDNALREIAELLSDSCSCQNSTCRSDFGAYLEKDDRTESDDRGLMVRCSRCNWRHYGKLIR